MNGLAYERLHSNLQRLKLHTVDTIIDNYLEIAAREGKTTLEVLDYLVDQEKHAKDAASQETRMKLAGFPVKKRLEDFDFDFQPSIDRAVISDLAMLRFVYPIMLRMLYSWVLLGWESPIWQLLLVLKLLKPVFQFILLMQVFLLKPDFDISKYFLLRISSISVRKIYLTVTKSFRVCRRFSSKFL